MLKTDSFNNCDNQEDNCDEMDIIEEAKNLEQETTDSEESFTHESTQKENKENNFFFSLYKQKNTETNQSKRREELLVEQKRRRNNLVDLSRGISLENIVEEVKEEKKLYKHKNKKYFNKIMLSEWFIDIPSDLDSNWYFKMSPIGHRCLVVAQRHKTKAFSKRGVFEEKFKSVLPGGYESDNYQKCTILDCLWDSKKQCFYVLDVLQWAGHDLTNYNAEFRFFWLQSQLKDICEINSSSDNNTYPFYYIEHNLSNQATINKNFFEYTANVDGILFYHKESSYTSGRTPLVGWLKPYMVPEMLQININERFNLDKPEKYVDLKSHVEYGNYLRNKGRNKKHMMETEHSEQ